MPSPKRKTTRPPSVFRIPDPIEPTRIQRLHEPVRSGAVFSADGNGPQSATEDGITYLIQACTNLQDFTELATVPRSNPIDTTELPTLSPGYE